MFSYSDHFIAFKNHSCEYGTSDGIRLKPLENPFHLSEKVSQIYETNDPTTILPGYAIITVSGKLFFHPNEDETGLLIPLPQLKVTDPKKITFFPDQITAIIDNSQLIISSASQTILETSVPNNSFFSCFNVNQALLCSPEENILLLISFLSDKEFDIKNLPGGYASLTCASFVDDNSFAFTKSNDKFVYLYNWEDETIKMVETNRNIVKMISCEVDSFETACICLTEENEVLCVRFSSNTCVIIGENIKDFCIIHCPFDSIIAMTNDEKEKIKILKGHTKEPLNASLNQMIDALNSRVLSSLCDLSQTRERLVLREQLSSKEEDFQLNDMVTLFGEEPQETTKEKSSKNEKEKQKFWIENLTNEITFEIHSDFDIPRDSCVFITSNSATFESRIETELNTENNILYVHFWINVESIISVDCFYVFIKIDDDIEFVGVINIPIQFLVSSSEIPRIQKIFRVSYPKKNFSTPKHLQEVFSSCEPKKSQKMQSSLTQSLEIDAIEGGAIMKISADTSEHFAQRLLSANDLVPESSTFAPIENQKQQFSSAFEIAKTVSRFTQMPENNSTDISLLLSLKSLVNEGLASLYS